MGEQQVSEGARHGGGVLLVEVANLGTIGARDVHRTLHGAWSASGSAVVHDPEPDPLAGRAPGPRALVDGEGYSSLVATIVCVPFAVTSICLTTRELS